MIPLKHLHIIVPYKKGYKCTVCQRTISKDAILFQWAKCIACGGELIITKHALSKSAILCPNCRQFEDPLQQAAELNLLELSKNETIALIEQRENEQRLKLNEALRRAEEFTEKRREHMQRVTEARESRRKFLDEEKERKRQERLKIRQEEREKRLKEKEEKMIAKAQLKLTLKGIKFEPQKAMELLEESGKVNERKEDLL